jgi:hypothetical protein
MINQEVEHEIQEIDRCAQVNLNLSPLSLVISQENPPNESFGSPSPKETASSLDIQDIDFTNNDVSLEIAKCELKASLSQWSLKHNVSHAALNDLPVILKPHVIDSNIPNCAKTLLRTPARVQLQCIAGGQFFYFGVLDQIKIEAERGLVACKFPIVQKLESKYPNKDFLTLSVSTMGFRFAKAAMCKCGLFFSK